jgi:hypothetical protein
MPPKMSVSVMRISLQICPIAVAHSHGLTNAGLFWKIRTGFRICLDLYSFHIINWTYCSSCVNQHARDNNDDDAVDDSEDGDHFHSCRMISIKYVMRRKTIFTYIICVCNSIVSLPPNIVESPSRFSECLSAPPMAVPADIKKSIVPI